MFAIKILTVLSSRYRTQASMIQMVTDVWFSNPGFKLDIPMIHSKVFFSTQKRFDTRKWPFLFNFVQNVLNVNTLAAQKPNSENRTPS